MSMKCPTCSAPARCTDSRPSANNATYRRYECAPCKRRWTTLEQFVRFDISKGSPVAGQLKKRLQKEAIKGIIEQLNEMVGDDNIPETIRPRLVAGTAHSGSR